MLGRRYRRCDSGAVRPREALGDVGEPGVVAPDPVEQRPGPGQVAGSLLEVGERVPEAQVVRLGLGDLLVGAGEQRDRLVEAAPVGERAGGDDPALGDELGARGRGRELLASSSSTFRHRRWAR